MPLTQQQVDEWRRHPVTEALRQALQQEVAQWREILCRHYLAGNPRPEAEREACQWAARTVDDLFQSSADEINAVTESEDV